jgi:hypothetical protein
MLVVGARADGTEYFVQTYYVPEPLTGCPIIAYTPIESCSVPCEPPQAIFNPATVSSEAQPQKTFRAESLSSSNVPTRQPTLAPDKEVKKDAGEYYDKLVPTISPRRLKELRAR